MKVAVVSDVHGNLPALEACLAAIERAGCHRILCLGDTFGYLPDGQACFDLLRSSGARMLLGNHEAMLLERLPVSPESETVYQLEPRRAELGADTRAALDTGSVPGDRARRARIPRGARHLRRTRCGGTPTRTATTSG